jgi:hypothetical protein
MTKHAGGCLCGALRYTAEGEPLYSGHCYCADCRRASGSGFIPFMSFPAGALQFSGETVQVRSTAYRGGEAVRNRCAVCGSLVFGGEVGKDETHTIYAGSLDAPERFRPTLAIFIAGRPAWAALPEGLKIWPTLPE